MVEAADEHHRLAPYLKRTAGMAARFWIIFFIEFPSGGMSAHSTQ
jgi:hypothetical protein